MKWAVYWVSLALGIAGCIDTTLDTPNNHPANPSANPAAPSQAPAALSSGFDPFVAYSNEAEPEAAASGHDRSHSAEPAPATATSGNAHDHATHVTPKAQPSAQAPAEDAVVYTCPMHPEIIRNAPGNCPICGMKLVPKKPSNQ